MVLEWHSELSKERAKRGFQVRTRRFFEEELVTAGGNTSNAALAALKRAKASLVLQPLTQMECNQVAGKEEDAYRHLVVLTLAEAETLRWVIRRKSHPVTQDVGFALRIVSGRLLDQSCAFMQVPGSKDFDVDRLLCMLRLFNSDMFFRDDELASLELQLKDVPLFQRQTWFEECLRLRRRRARYIWLDTPVARLFTPQEEWASIRSKALMKILQRALREKSRSEDVKALLQPEWSHDALRNFLLHLRLGLSASDLQIVVEALPVDGRGVILGEVVEEALKVKEAVKTLTVLEGQRVARQAQDELERQEKENRVWQCQNCTFINSAMCATCAVCDYGWTGQRECPPDKWCCTASTGGCTFFNPKTFYYCDVCGRARPDLSSLCF